MLICKSKEQLSPFIVLRRVLGSKKEMTASSFFSVHTVASWICFSVFFTCLDSMLSRSWTVQELKAINDIPDKSQRLARLRQMEAERVLLQQSRKDLQKAMQNQQMAMQNQQMSMQTISKAVDKMQKDADKIEAKYEAELLRAKGVMTSRGVFERMAQLAWTEQGLSGSKFVCTDVLQKLCNNPQAGKWSTCMYDSAVTCDPNTVALETLVKVWNELSDPMHGQSFSGLEVQVLDR